MQGWKMGLLWCINKWVLSVSDLLKQTIDLRKIRNN